MSFVATSNLRVLNEAQALLIVDAAIQHYLTERYAKIKPFVDQHFTFIGSLKLHRRAIGWDLLRSPINLLLAPPHLGLNLAGQAVQRLGAKRSGLWLTRRNLLLRTDVAREVTWRVQTELLERPVIEYDRQGRVTRRADCDALAEIILRDPQLDCLLQPLLTAIRKRAEDPGFRSQLVEKLSVYAGSRTAGNEITTALLITSLGAATFRDFTPGALGLGSLLATALAQHAAIASFPLGASAGGLWYTLFPVAPSLGFNLAITGGVMGTAAVLSSFAGLVSDPLERRFGLHERRLHRLLDTIAADLVGSDETKLTLRGAYVARLLDLLDMLRTLYRLAH